MGVRTYQAYSVTEALDAAKRDLGADAVVLETRTFRRGGFLGLGRRSVYEVTATRSERALRSAEAGGGRAAAARQAYRGRADVQERDRGRLERLAAALAEAQRLRARHVVPGPASSGVLAAAGAGATPSVQETGGRPGGDPPGLEISAPADPPQRLARRFILTPADSGGSVASACVAPPEPLPGAPGASEAPPVGSVTEELARIREMVGRVLAHQTGPRAAPAAERIPLPPRLLDSYLELLERDLSEDLADRVVREALRVLESSSLDDGAAVREAVLARLAALVPAAEVSAPRRHADDRPHTIALVGPTGVGKTTTLAKLAANYKLREGLRVGLLTCDTYRIAAVDQLRMYASIMGIPLEVALSAAEVRRAVAALAACDVVLIDTAGRGPDDAVRLGELRRCLEAAAPHEIHLVLSGTAGERVLLREAEAFSGAGADRLVVTKLDETITFGSLINVLHRVGKGLSFVTTGQEVPDHIEVGRPRRIAELALGAAVHA